MARVDSIQKPTTLLTLKKSKEVATETAGNRLGEIMLITDDDGTVQGDIRITTGKPYHTMPFVHVGSVIYYAGEIAPDGYLPCDGSFVSQKLYPELFDKIGYFWWKQPFQNMNFWNSADGRAEDYNEIYFMGTGSYCNTSVKNQLKNRYKILIIDNKDHPVDPIYNVSGEIFKDKDDVNEFYYDKITYDNWAEYRHQNPISNSSPNNDNITKNYNFNNALAGVPIVREPFFPLPDFTQLFTADESNRDKLAGYYVRNLNESKTEHHPDYYKTEYDERGLWCWGRHYSSETWRKTGNYEFHKTLRTYSSLQESEIRRHRHEATDARVSISGKHAHQYHGSQGSTNGDPLGKKTGGVSGRSDTFGRKLPGSGSVSTFPSGTHRHAGYVGYGYNVEHENHKTFVDGKPDTENIAETRPWSYAVQFCIKY